MNNQQRINLTILIVAVIGLITGVITFGDYLILTTIQFTWMEREKK